MAFLISSVNIIATISVAGLSIIWFFQYKKISTLLILLIAIASVYDNVILTFGFFSNANSELITATKIGLLLYFISLPLAIAAVFLQAIYSRINWLENIQIKILTLLFIIILWSFGVKSFFSTSYHIVQLYNMFQIIPDNTLIFKIVAYSVFIFTFLIGLLLHKKKKKNKTLFLGALFVMLLGAITIMINSQFSWVFKNFIGTIFLFMLSYSDILTIYNNYTVYEK